MLFTVKKDSVRIEAIADMVKGGEYAIPIKFGRPSSQASFNENGYSDHFPISMVIEEK
ncbi:hypothetical protein Q0590_28560 [Rhodocytophaga aerolata]|uniref:Uncharacterized protein n=1 Tax=Rhodocytophaga aerolata TaxID=455078 RepID=A0ABT8RHU8_9BACT|nr:hypothetical protein [Rhodocytophaga aerolata]MDO1450267.1 hypothetical protein [Rhodocytophaga aerolata]